MKNLPSKKLSREELRNVSGSGAIKFCTYECCPTDGRPLCPGFACPAVVCPQLS